LVGLTSLSAHKCVSGAFYNTLSLGMTNKTPISSFDSEITFTYETDHLELESETDFELDGYSQHQLGATFEHNLGELEAEVTFEPDTELPADFNLQEAVALEDKAKTELLAELDADYSGRSNNRLSYDLEWGFELERHIIGDLKTEIVLTCEEDDITFPLPTETAFQLVNLQSSNIALDTSIEFEKAEIDAINLDFEFIEPILHSPKTMFSTDMEWEPSQDFIECDPEIDFNWVTISAESEIFLKNKSFFNSVRLQEISFDGVDIMGITVDLSLDLESRNVEIELSTKNDPLQLEFEIKSNQTNNEPFLYLDKFHGEFEWETEDFGEFELEFESDEETFPDKITISSKHDF